MKYIVDSMENLIEQVGSATQKQLVQRHADIYFDYHKEFQTSKHQIRQMEEAEEEKPKAEREDGDTERELLLKERGRIDAASSSADHVIEYGI